MKNYYFKFKKAYLILIILLTFGNSFAQSDPFNCNTEAYLFQSNDVYAQNLASGAASLDGIDLTASIINGVGYNSKDGYIWGSLKSPSNTIVRIGNNYEMTTYTVPNSPYSYVGDVNQDGIYYLKNGSSSFYKIDLDPESANYLTNIGTGYLSEAITNHDWAFNAVDDMLYAVEKHSNILYRIDPGTGNVQSLGEVPVLSGLSYTYGAVYFDVDGNFYVSANQTGTVYVIYAVQDVTQSSDMNSNFFAFGPSSSQNDGARCPTAPVPQENCANGTDDDGDGLVDCDDPSCSGVAACPEITTTTSGNGGGLESNNRLSAQINQRNIKRIKANYKFDVKKAKRVMKTNSYAKRSVNDSISLWDFIPMDIITGANAVESSPKDLKDITNATEVVSVDYLRNDKGIGTLLALKTEEKVYEHTKHICDRFTGAELLSVSNLEINDALFIKSVVKQPDGSIEFVASFSVRESDDKASFVVESHWNLDKYAEKGYYNFQIWASSIDDLYKLAEEVLRLVKIQKPIIEYKSSEAPPIYIKKAGYKNGQIQLEIINKLKATTVLLEGFKRETETSDSEKMSYVIDLPDYVNVVSLDTENLYDFGFRLNNEFNMTPDDLFVSDGTWGIDYSSEEHVNTFEVAQNEVSFDDNVYEVERNIELTTQSNQDVSIYRSLTPKFEKVDLTSYELMSFKIKGNGKLRVTLVKESISSWENQPSIVINLNATEQKHIIYKQDFSKQFTEELKLDDVKMLFFTLLGSDSGKKELELKEVQFLKEATASTDDFQLEDEVVVVPNPIKEVANFNFISDNIQSFDFEIYNVLSKRVYHIESMTKAGKNKIPFNKGNLSSGIYFYKIRLKERELKGKIVIK